MRADRRPHPISPRGAHDPHEALLEHVTNPAFYGAQPSSVRMLV
jgi:hypothetical protein